MRLFHEIIFIYWNMLPINLTYSLAVYSSFNKFQMLSPYVNDGYYWMIKFKLIVLFFFLKFYCLSTLKIVCNEKKILAFESASAYFIFESPGMLGSVGTVLGFWCVTKSLSLLQQVSHTGSVLRCLPYYNTVALLWKTQFDGLNCLRAILIGLSL